LCEHLPTYFIISSLLSDVVAIEGADPLSSWNNDRVSWLRTASGYSGLKNLTNTCYMNSLTTQLFMNDKFRTFIFNLPTPETTEYNIIAAMQELFAKMQTGYLKATDTSRFAYAIRPWDAEHIDVTVQMDVDEFNAILFDRLEDALPDADTKRELRSFWGGQVITQVKSQDCEHVSERAEPFLTIQCEVKGKMSLEESLSAYVEGDHMGGGKSTILSFMVRSKLHADNKYKCESCDGRFVNAIKR
jgi:ubiquitin carboxyl-terminal hydrolase 34